MLAYALKMLIGRSGKIYQHHLRSLLCLIHHHAAVCHIGGYCQKNLWFYHRYFPAQYLGDGPYCTVH